MTDRGNERYKRLPPVVDPDALVVEVPAFEDDRPAPEPVPPAAAPELVAATQIAQGSGGVRTIRRTQISAALVIAGIPIGVLAVVAIAQILLAD
ncbi:hypothetical protein [Curtobacterium sp. ISL-83]|uniref:hypothetical protein n=1 Tax=Curtobacterium sp. ISL-83 TaxID=2819145 RepID=UPI001BEC778D|nr:hypothetical protein [Curtobacterium sp. ISL-83]MBT2503869.1 hypothetical protein [Curtobacterium sp. ISL-83]